MKKNNLEKLMNKMKKNLIKITGLKINLIVVIFFYS